MSKKIGAILARLTPIGYQSSYQIDFSRHENYEDSDDEGNEWQWNYPIRFTYTNLNGNPLFLNTDEIPYNTVERYTCATFWKSNSTTIIRLISDTFKIRKARGEPIPDWSISQMCTAGDSVWYKFQHK
jgi:hypothetical protein